VKTDEGWEFLNYLNDLEVLAAEILVEPIRLRND
jgi:hypothetical protein